MFPVEKTSAESDSRDIVKERSVESIQNHPAEHIYPRKKRYGLAGS